MLQAERLYHIYNHANGFENLFLSDENYRFFLRRWQKYIEPIAATYCYCLMPNHFHVLVQIKQEKALLVFFDDKLKKSEATGFENLSLLISKQFANLFTSYAKAFNKQQSRRGSLFNRPFKYKMIDNENYLMNVVKYIHLNPVHHGFVEDVESWQWTSYHELKGETDTFLNRRQLLDWFDGRKLFEDFHSEGIDRLIEDKTIYLE